MTTDATRNDWLGTAMVNAQVAAAILANLRGDDDAPYVARHLRTLEAAIAALHQALQDLENAPAA